MKLYPYLYPTDIVKLLYFFNTGKYILFLCSLQSVCECFFSHSILWFCWSNFFLFDLTLKKQPFDKLVNLLPKTSMSNNSSFESLYSISSWTQLLDPVQRCGSYLFSKLEMLKSIGQLLSTNLGSAERCGACWANLECSNPFTRQSYVIKLTQFLQLYV